MGDNAKNIEAMLVEAVLTSHTCGEGCWYARERTCRCSCGGKNHGCLLDGATERPTRTSKIDGELYKLEAVGPYAELYRAAADALTAVGPKMVICGSLQIWWSATDKGAPVRLRAATKQQSGSWKELSAAKPGAYLLWRRVAA